MRGVFLALALVSVGATSAAAGPDSIIREADAIIRRGPRYDPGHPAFYTGKAWLAELTLRRCSRPYEPGVTPSRRACVAAAGSVRR